MTKQTENPVTHINLHPITICVFCGSRKGHDPKHLALAEALGRQIAIRGHSLVYGGGGLGLMGACANAAFSAGAKVTGVIPHFLKEAEKTLACVEHEYVETMHERKLSMFDQADAFIVLPGGIGTLEEAIEVLSWLRLNLHLKPVLFLSDANYWDSLLETLYQIVDDGFAGESMRDDILSATSIEGAFDIIAQEILNPREREALTISSGGSGVIECG